LANWIVSVIARCSGQLVRQQEVNVLVSTITVTITIIHRFQSTPTNRPRFTEPSLPCWSPILVLTEIDGIIILKFTNEIETAIQFNQEFACKATIKELGIDQHPNYKNVSH